MINDRARTHDMASTTKSGIVKPWMASPSAAK